MCTRDRRAGSILAITILAILTLGCNVREISLNEQLMQVSTSGDVDMAKLLLDQGADVKTKNEFDETPLFYAVANDHIEVVKVLIGRNADVNAVDQTGDSILSLARNPAMARVLKTAGAYYSLPQKLTWRTTSLLSGKVSIEAPGEIKPSKFPQPKSDHPIFKSGQSFYTDFGPVELAILVGELRGPGGPSTIELGRQYLKYSAEIKKLKIQTITPYTSKASKDSIQLLGRCQQDPSVTWDMVVHSARKGKRQVLVRLLWPGKDKRSLDVAFRISNSLRMK